MNLGIDFGSTYSMLSVYDPANDTVQPLILESGSPYIPSIACYDEEGNLITGHSVKEQIGYLPPDVRLFRAFKMLLTAHPERDRQTLLERGYTDEVTPGTITQEFLRQQIEIAKEHYRVEKFDNLVICIPEVWDTELHTMGGRDTLLKICRKLNAAEHITVVTEPAAASAYFAHNYWKNYQKPYQGKILIVDYGGGTLDITLADVHTTGGTHMEIQTLWQTGAGDNHPVKSAGNHTDGDTEHVQVGDAGIAYMEEAVRLALRAVSMNVPPEKDVGFLRLFTQLESALINNAGKFSTQCKKYKSNPKKLGTDEGVFVILYGEGKKIPVTYAMLYQAYQNMIYPVLDRQLDIIIEKIRSKLNIDPVRALPAGQDDFKIALVGGFGQFYLVRQQLEEKFHLTSARDARLRGLDEQGANGVPLDNGQARAICYGAALLAADVLTMHKTALYSIGLVYTDGGQDTFDFAILKGSELQYGEVYYVLNRKQHCPRKMFYSGPSSSGSTWRFAFWREEGSGRAYNLKPCEKVQHYLENSIPANSDYIYGFSMDSSGVYTLHIYGLDYSRKDGVGEEVTRLSLGNLSDFVGANIDLTNCKYLEKPAQK